MLARARRLHGQSHVFQHREVGKQVGQLKGPPQTRTGAGRRAHAVQVVAVEQDRATGGLDLPGDEIEVRRLARAIGPDDGRQCSRPKCAADGVHRHVSAKSHRQIFGS